MEFVNENNNNVINNQNNKENINELKNKIKKLENEKNSLENKMNELKTNNKKYENEINILKNKLKEYENENKELKNTITNLNNLLNNGKNKIISYNNKDRIIELMDELKIKENEIKEIKSIIPFNLQKGEKLMTVIFYSVDQKIHYSLICKNTDKFSVIEQRLFEVYPESQDENYYFMANGIQINRYKTLEALKLTNSAIITMNK